MPGDGHMAGLGPYPSVMKLSSLLLASTLSVKWEDEGDDAGTFIFSHIHFLNPCWLSLRQSFLSCLCQQSLLGWPVSPHCRHTGHSVQQHSFSGNPCSHGGSSPYLPPTPNRWGFQVVLIGLDIELGCFLVQLPPHYITSSAGHYETLYEDSEPVV
jgi:hypothetical protein